MAAKKTAKKAANAADSSIEKPAKKTPAKNAAKKATVKKSAKAEKPEKKTPPSPDIIAKSAYLNYRRRVENGLPGDSHGDWLHAERQLRDEP